MPAILFDSDKWANTLSYIFSTRKINRKARWIKDEYMKNESAKLNFQEKVQKKLKEVVE